MNVTIDINLNKSTFNKIEVFPSMVLYSVAKQTLSISYPTIPKDTGKMKEATYSYGVKKHTDNDYSISSNVGYARYPWFMNDGSTNWTTPGTGSKWFTKTIQKRGKLILTNAILQSR